MKTIKKSLFDLLRAEGWKVDESLYLDMEPIITLHIEGNVVKDIKYTENS